MDNITFDGMNEWDTDKEPHSNIEVRKDVSSLYTMLVTSLDNVKCEDISFSDDNTHFTLSKGNLDINVTVGKITSIDRKGLYLIINTEDEVPYSVSFYDEFELESSENRIFDVMNQRPDPGCAVPYDNVEFSGDFDLSFF